MLIQDYAAARHLAARLELGINHNLCKQRIGQSVEQVVEALCPSTLPTLTNTPLISNWEDMSIFYTSSFEKKQVIDQLARREGTILSSWWLEQIHKTNAPLWERMTLFWHNHFTSSLQKVLWPQWMFKQHQLLRQYALGNFAELLHAIAKDPAMLSYLDGAKNIASSPNENFARELLELFTLGVGHYSEQDIINVARAFSGWNLDPIKAEFLFRTNHHDNTQKQFLGKVGNFNGTDIINIILDQQRTAEYIAEKFWKEFINYDQPDAAIIKDWASAFRDSGYEIKTLLLKVVTSSVFWEQAQRGSLIKSPIEFTLGLLRELQIPFTEYQALRIANLQLGQELFNPPDVKGWRGGKDWITNTRLIRRYDLIPKFLAEHSKDLQSLVNQFVTKNPSVGNSNSTKLSALLNNLLPKSSCSNNSSALLNWLLPISPVAAPNCNLPIEKILITVLKDPTYQLR
ncbi:DUF1800 domain-containing protein [uncultured Thiothrix sp.]|uniref:DUF1800 domain-containing protein n=1 Tax=uncultured Thiothrix sp. TaxID=223185 RepID=UPI00261BC1DC|nr:DUF1800 domain-containing protein [uncultured Thiothrix sp.]